MWSSGKIMMNEDTSMKHLLATTSVVDFLKDKCNRDFLNGYFTYVKESGSYPNYSDLLSHTKIVGQTKEGIDLNSRYIDRSKVTAFLLQEYDNFEY